MQELTTELETAKRDADQQRAAERQASQSQIDALNDRAEEGKAELSDAGKQIADLKKQLVATAAQLETLNIALAKAEGAAEQATKKTRELEQAATSSNAEIERLKAELEQRSLPPASVSPRREDNLTPQ